jgi:hypothetical protein
MRLEYRRPSLAAIEETPGIESGSDFSGAAKVNAGRDRNISGARDKPDYRALIGVAPGGVRIGFMVSPPHLPLQEL